MEDSGFPMFSFRTWCLGLVNPGGFPHCQIIYMKNWDSSAKLVVAEPQKFPGPLQPNVNLNDWFEVDQLAQGHVLVNF